MQSAYTQTFDKKIHADIGTFRILRTIHIAVKIWFASLYRLPT